MKVPCGQCVGCRLERSRQWAVRCVHEAQMHDRNCFITLTYDDEHLPPGGTLVLAHFQKFMKRLRKEYGAGIRYYHCGEYGEEFGRPHYHACLFNHDFEDKKPWKKLKSGELLYISASLQRLWPLGYSSVGAVTFNSAAYVARYVMKKVYGANAREHYTAVDPSSGEVFERTPEYTTMSRRPGVGAGWFARFGGDVFPADEVVLAGRRLRPPKYYDRLFEVSNPNEMRSIKARRILEASKHSEDQTPRRLADREEVQKEKLSRLPRPLK